jgi:hypothetical protein
LKNDLISWLLEYAQGEERTVDRIIQRIFSVNGAAIHTTSNVTTPTFCAVISHIFMQTLSIAILHLATNPEYILPLRQEVAEVVAQHGWTKAALSKMRKVDSFLKESSRYEGIMPGGLSFHEMDDPCILSVILSVDEPPIRQP